MENNSKIYVAGHNGMVGSAIVRKLNELGYNNIVTRSHEELDLCDQNSVSRFFAEEKPEYVFDAAALVGGIKANSTYPADFLIKNLQIQNNIFENSKVYNVKKLLFLGSSCIYPKECEMPIREDELLTGKPEPTNEAYAIAKIAGIKACEYYNKQYQTNYIAVMPANSYGINDSFDPENSHVIPALIRKYHEAKVNNLSQVTMWGSGKALREFLYVDDLADACVFLMNNYEKNEFINIGTGEEISIYDLSNLIKKVTGYQGEIVCDLTKPDGMLRRVVDSSKLKDLGWKPSVDMEHGLKQVYQWFLENIEQE